MEYYLQQKLMNDKNFKRYILENSYHIKYLNRNPEYHKDFMRQMKELYKERTTDKINNAINTIDIVSSVIDSSSLFSMPKIILINQFAVVLGLAPREMHSS